MSSDLLIMLFIGTRFCNLLVDAMMIHLQPRLDQQVYGRRPVLLGYYRVVCSITWRGQLDFGLADAIFVSHFWRAHTGARTRQPIH